MPEKADAVSEDGRPSGLARTPRKVGHPQTSTADPVSLRCGEGTGSRFRRKDGQAGARDSKGRSAPEVAGSVASAKPATRTCTDDWFCVLREWSLWGGLFAHSTDRYWPLTANYRSAAGNC